MPTLTRVLLRGYEEPGFDQPIHVSLCDGADGAIEWSESPHSALDAATQAAVDALCAEARTARGITVGAPVLVQIEATGQAIAGEPTGTLRAVELDPAATSAVLTAFAARAGATLPTPEP